MKKWNKSIKSKWLNKNLAYQYELLFYFIFESYSDLLINWKKLEAILPSGNEQY